MQLNPTLADRLTSMKRRWEQAWERDQVPSEVLGGFASHGSEPRIDDGEYDLSNNRKPDFVQADDAGWEA